MTKETNVISKIRNTTTNAFGNPIEYKDLLKNDSSIIQGFPDLLILNGNKWAALEVKTSRLAKVQPNQKYYIDVLDSMSYASFIFPENEKDVLNELQKALRIRGTTRFFRG